MKKNTKNFFKFISFSFFFFLGITNVSATVLNTLSDTMSSIKIGNLSNHEFSFITPTGVQAGETIILTFPNGFSIPAGLTFLDVDINIGGQYVGSTTLADTPSGGTLGVERTAADIITITNGTTVIPGGSIVNIKIGTNATHQTTGTFQITNDSSIGNKAISIAGSFGDYGTSTVILLSDDSVQILATVPQSFTFSISTNSIDFGSLSTVSPKYASSTNSGGDNADTEAHSLSVATNANAGYTITILGQTLTSQHSALNTISPNGSVPVVSSPGSEQFGMYATKTGVGSGVIDSTYATVSAFGYDTSATTPTLFASASSANGTAEVYHLHYIANISVITEAGSYSTSIVYAGTANF